MTNVYLITIATHSEGYYKALKEGAEKGGFKFVTLGWGKKWEGFSWKIILVKDFIKTLNPNDVVIIIDAFDMICTDTKENVLNKFLSMNTGILFSRDQTNVENNMLNDIRKKEFGTCKNYVINAGAYMGYVKYIKVLYDSINVVDPKIDDQVLIIDFCNKNKDFIDKYVKIDTKGDIFFNCGCDSTSSLVKGLFSNTTKCNIGLEIDKEQIINPKNKNSPSFIHGVGRINLDEYCKAKDYSTFENRKTSMIGWILGCYPSVRKNIIIIICFIILVCMISIIVVRQCKKDNIYDNRNRR